MASFECIWPETVGSSSHLEGTKNGVAGPFRGATERWSQETYCQSFAENEVCIGPNPVEKIGTGLMLPSSCQWTGHHQLASICLSCLCLWNCSCNWDDGGGSYVRKSAEGGDLTPFGYEPELQE